MSKIIEHKRVLKNLLYSLELPAINWMGRHLPAWVNSDMMTLLGIFSAVVICVSYWLSRFNPLWLWAASLAFVIHWVGDSLDGHLARVRNRQRPRYGFFIDHSSDTLSMILIFLGIGLSPYARVSFALLTLISYLCMSIMVYLRTCTEGVFEFSFGKVGPTEMRLLAILMNAGLFFFKNPHVRMPWGIGRLTYLDIFGFVVSAVFMGTFIVSMLKYGIIYARQDGERLKAGNTPKTRVRRGL
ncbi:MAG: CDP-alcohol phosphatidyltransferase family protein [Candidatus Aminicenantes bacterium]|nr:CDP-alcohol phosphatidyltransferase family protein [Candidatus Aminicenantes bacterium]